jgi:hypothetical protein
VIFLHLDGSFVVGYVLAYSSSFMLQFQVVMAGMQFCFDLFDRQKSCAYSESFSAGLRDETLME